MIYMVPQLKMFVQNMGQALLPLQTQVLFFVPDPLVAYWYARPVLAGRRRLTGKAMLHTNPSRVSVSTASKLPLVGDIMRKIILARFTNTFALLYASGIPIIESIRTTQDVVGNLVVRRALERVEQLIGEGMNVTDGVPQHRFLSPLVIRMLRVGESTGRWTTRCSMSVTSIIGTSKNRSRRCSN